MSHHLQREIEKLKKKILSLSAMVEESFRRAVQSVEEPNIVLADEVMDRDREIDEVEVEVEEDCLKILALHQPVAVDLRFIIAVMKINNDLERIGDLAVNIAGEAHFLAIHGKLYIDFDLHGMAEKVEWMLKSALDCLVNLDTDLAQKVCRSDDVVDDMNREMHLLVANECRNHPEWSSSLIDYLVISRNLERIADLTTNIAEDVIYMTGGKIIRHLAQYQEQAQKTKYLPPGT